MRVAVFDLDGTLADTAIDLIAAANATLVDAGLSLALDVGTDWGVALKGGRSMLRAGFGRLGVAVSEERITELYPILLEHYRGTIDMHSRLYPGVVQALDRLEAAGWLLSVCTNKPIALADLLLARLGIAHRFAATLGADSLDVRKPDARHVRETVLRACGRHTGGSVARAVFIGDTETDRDAARAAGLPCVLVTFGPEGEGIARLEPDALLTHYDDLPGILETLVPHLAIPA